MTSLIKTALTLTDEDTRQEAVERLTTYFPLQVSGYECTVETVFDVLVKAVVTRHTVKSWTIWPMAKPFAATSIASQGG